MTARMVALLVAVMVVFTASLVMISAVNSLQRCLEFNPDAAVAQTGCPDPFGDERSVLSGG